MVEQAFWTDDASKLAEFLRGDHAELVQTLVEDGSVAHDMASGIERLALSRARERHALRLIADHARLDRSERGIAECERYAVIAEEALSRPAPVLQEETGHVADSWRVPRSPGLVEQSPGQEETGTRELVARLLHERFREDDRRWAETDDQYQWLRDADALIAALPTGGGRERSAAACMLAEFEGHPNSRPTPVELEIALHEEEDGELVEALRLLDSPLEPGSLAILRKHIARELADKTYLAYRSAQVHGIDLDAALRIIHAKAMEKIEANVRDKRGKIVKPPGFVAPDLTPALIEEAPAPASSTGDGERVDNGIPRSFWREVPCGHPPDPVAMWTFDGDATCHCGSMLDPNDALGVEVPEAPGPIVYCQKCGCHVAVPPKPQSAASSSSVEGGGRYHVIEHRPEGSCTISRVDDLATAFGDARPSRGDVYDTVTKEYVSPDDNPADPAASAPPPSSVETGDGRELREWTITGSHDGPNAARLTSGPHLDADEEVRVREVSAPLPSKETRG